MRIAGRIATDLFMLALALLILYVCAHALWEHRELWRWWMPVVGLPVLAAYVWAAHASYPAFLYRLLLAVLVQFVVLMLVGIATG